MKKNPRIAYIGDLTADRYVDSGTVKLGGAALNMAMWTKRVGGNPVIYSAVGNDAIGSTFPTGVGIQKKRGHTSSIDIRLTSHGERMYGTWDPGVFRTYQLRDRDRARIKKLDAAVITVYPPHIRLLQALPISPMSVINLGEFPYEMAMLETYAQHVYMMVFGLDKDRDEERINGLRAMAREFGLLVIVTLGQYGSVAWHQGASYVQPAKAVPVVDTTGAGDAFLAGFMVSYLQSQDIQKSLAKGSEIAAMAVARIGAY